MLRRVRLGTVVAVARKHALAPRYRLDERMTLVAEDGVRLTGARLAGPPGSPATVVLAHGFAHSSRTPRVHTFARLLSRHLNVIVPDLRGHGRSEGVCTMGIKEPLDVAAAVTAAPAGLPVVTVGISLGGAAVLLHAGTLGGVAGVVAISAPAWAGAWDTASTRRIQRYATSPAGRQVLARLLHTRVAERCDPVPDARELVAGIAPAFTLIVADPGDHFFSEDHPRTLYEWARPPKDLWLMPGTGHGTDLLGPTLAGRLVAHLQHRLSLAGGSAG